MRTRQFQYLSEIGRHQTLTASAQNLHITVQSLGASIRAMEAELGCLLLIRTYHGVTLTEAGKVLAQLGDVYFHNLQVVAQKYNTAACVIDRAFRFSAMPHIAKNDCRIL